MSNNLILISVVTIFCLICIYIYSLLTLLKSKEEELKTIDEAHKNQQLISTMENFIANNLSTFRKSSAAGISIQNVAADIKIRHYLVKYIV